MDLQMCIGVSRKCFQKNNHGGEWNSSYWCSTKHSNMIWGMHLGPRGTCFMFLRVTTLLYEGGKMFRHSCRVVYQHWRDCSPSGHSWKSQSIHPQAFEASPQLQTSLSLFLSDVSSKNITAMLPSVFRVERISTSVLFAMAHGNAMTV